MCYDWRMKLSDYAKSKGISYQTAWRMWKRGELKATQLPTGTVIVDVQKIIECIIKCLETECD